MVKRQYSLALAQVHERNRQVLSKKEPYKKLCTPFESRVRDMFRLCRKPAHKLTLSPRRLRESSESQIRLADSKPSVE